MSICTSVLRPRKSHATTSQYQQIQRHFQPDAIDAGKGKGRSVGCRESDTRVLAGHGHHLMIWQRDGHAKSVSL